MRTAALIIILTAAAIMAGGCSETQTTANPLFPDPYVAGGAANIIFTDLSASCTIEITTLDGELIRSITESDGDGQATWDIKNTDGEDVVAGIYLYLITSPDDEKKGKLIISR